MLSMRKTAAAALLLASFSTAFAAGAPLPAGKPAGTKEAAMAGGGITILVGLGVVAAFTAALASQDSKDGVTTPTTATTGTGV